MSLDPNIVGAFLEGILKSKEITNYGALLINPIFLGDFEF